MAGESRTEAGTRRGWGARLATGATQVVRFGVPTLLVGMAVALTAAAAQAITIQTAGAGRWKLEYTPNPATAQISILASISCPSRRACTAVGSSSRTLSSASLPLAERWKGGRWRIQRTPNPPGTSSVLYGVSCPSTHSCVAVGNAFHRVGRNTTALTEIWNGKRWRVRSAQTIGRFSSLQAISCTTARACTAVGFYHGSGGREQALVERWNGRRWRVQTIPQPARITQFLGVSCPGLHACTAVGTRSSGTSNSQAFAESWNGKTWQVRTVPLPSGAQAGILEAVSCTSSSACTATGSDFAANGPTLAEHWNGKRWRVQRTPNPANYRVSIGEVHLDGVSCTSPTACTAVGIYTPGGATNYFIESWNGRRWRMKAAAHPADFARGALLGVSCAGGRCAAVGGYSGGTRIQVTMAVAD